MTICFTGHRALDAENISELFSLLESCVWEYAKKGNVSFRAGGALGFDTLAALVVLTAREKYPDITLDLILPCKNQTRGWRDTDIEKYNHILSEANSVTYVSEEYTRFCMMARNRALVDGADLCIAYCNKPDGGSAYTVKYAQSRDVKVINLADRC